MDDMVVEEECVISILQNYYKLEGFEVKQANNIQGRCEFEKTVFKCLLHE